MKFETPIVYGNENYGVLSIYVDMTEFYSAMHEHINSTRFYVALILLSIVMLVVLIVSFTAMKEVSNNVDKDG